MAKQKREHRRITAFEDKYEFLSNFYPSKVKLGNEVYPTVEHAFQAAKTLDENWRRAIRNAPFPGKAKSLGQKCPIRPDWEKIKFKIMHALLESKFKEPILRKQLLSTGDAFLIEGNGWGDEIWGACFYANSEDFEGENWLGYLLMLVRSKIEYMG